MCAAIGVDPLVGAKRDGWGVLGVGDFWMGVATRVVGICRNTRGENGGIIGVKEVQRLLEREDRRQRSQTVISEYVPPIFVVRPIFLGLLLILGMILCEVLVLWDHWDRGLVLFLFVMVNDIFVVCRKS
jgi:hypothetical protein